MSIQNPRLILGTRPEWLPTPLRQMVRWLLPIPKLTLEGKTLATHKRIIGVTGVGKTGLLTSIYWQLFREGVGVAFIDPHGDAVEHILQMLIHYGYFDKPGAYDRIWYIEFREDDDGYYLPFNVLNSPWIPPHDIISNVMDAFYRVWPALEDGSAPYFSETLSKGLRVLVDNHMTLFSLDRVLDDKKFREPLMAQVTDPDTIAYFKALEALPAEDRHRRVVTAVNRTTLMKDPPVLKYSLGQLANIMNFNDIIDKPICVLFNLHHLRNSDARAMIGALLAKFFEESALSRYDRPRTQYHLVIDEMAEFVSKSGKSFTKMLSETRKYNFFATFAHQNLGQLSDELRQAVQNVGCEIAMRVGANDAIEMARLLGLPIDPLMIKAESPVPERAHPIYSSLAEQREFQRQSLAALEERHLYARISPDAAVECVTLDLPYPKVDPQKVEEVKAEYRRRLMVPRSSIVLPHQQQQASGPSINTGGFGIP